MPFLQDKQKRKTITCRHKYIRHFHFGIPQDAENCVICEYTSVHLQIELVYRTL